MPEPAEPTLVVPTLELEPVAPEPGLELVELKHLGPVVEPEPEPGLGPEPEPALHEPVLLELVLELVHGLADFVPLGLADIAAGSVDNAAGTAVDTPVHTVSDSALPLFEAH